MNYQLLKTYNPISIIIRHKGYKPPGGIKYPGGIVYYPRHSNHEDPEYTPTKLFRVERIKSAKFFPHFQKRILADFKILEEERVTIVKNTPDNNMRLWKVKHLIKVTPITFPFGEPSENDINYTILKENGQCIVKKSLEPESKPIEALDAFQNNAKKMDNDTLKRESRQKWISAFV